MESERKITHYYREISDHYQMWNAPMEIGISGDFGTYVPTGPRPPSLPRIMKLSRQLNHGNTVMVNFVGNIWYHGFIQDIDGDLILVDFCDSPQWMESRHVYPYPYIDRCERGSDVLVALRTTTSTITVTESSEFRAEVLDVTINAERIVPYRKKFPLAFVPATLLSTVNGCHLYYIQVKHSGACKVVHRSHVIKEFPAPERSLYFKRNPDGDYVKHRVQLDDAHLLESIDECRLILEMGRMVGTSRFFMRFGTEDITFICWVNANTFQSNALLTERKLGQCVSNCLRMQVFASSCSSNQQDTGRCCLMAKPDGNMAVGEEHVVQELSNHHVPAEMLIEVLWLMDAQEQARMRKVCKGWNNLISEHSVLFSKHVIIDVTRASTEKLHPADYNYLLCQILDYVIDKECVSLTLTNWKMEEQFRASMALYKISALCQMLTLKSGHNPIKTIFLHNCFVGYELADVVFGYPERLRHLSPLLRLCKSLLLVHYLVDDNVLDGVSSMRKCPPC